MHVHQVYLYKVVLCQFESELRLLPHSDTDINNPILIHWCSYEELGPLPFEPNEVRNLPLHSAYYPARMRKG